MPAAHRLPLTASVRSLVLGLVLFLGCTGTIGEPVARLRGGARSFDDEGSPPAPAMMRLSVAQYRNSVADVFAPDLAPAPETLPPDRTGDDFRSIGASEVSTSEREAELYQDAAIAVAASVWAGRDRFEALRGCAPADAADPCIDEVVRRLGERLFRRPLTDEEVASHAAVARGAPALAGAEVVGAAEALALGMQYAIASLLASPSFLYVAASGEPDPEGEGLRYTSLEMASRLSYFLWDSTPDQALLARGRAGELVDPAAIAEEVGRMLDAPRGQELVVRFFEASWNVERLGTATKDPVRFPEWSPEIAAAAREEFRRVLLDLASEPGASILEVFSRRETYANERLAPFYGATVEGAELVPIALDASRAGLLTSVAVLAANAKPNRTSPTQRGVFLRWKVLCLPIPPPPEGVLTDLPEGEAGDDETLREQLERHRSDPLCSSCHSLFDPMGMTLESFDAIGRFRDVDRGLPIDPSGEFEGTHFEDARALAEFLRDDPRAARCLSDKLYTYATGQRRPSAEDAPADPRLAFRQLVTTVATSADFRRFTPEEP